MEMTLDPNGWSFRSAACCFMQTIEIVDMLIINAKLRRQTHAKSVSFEQLSKALSSVIRPYMLLMLYRHLI